jgi:hypothetical protein
VRKFFNSPRKRGELKMARLPIFFLAPKGTRPAKGVAVRCSRQGKEFTSGRARPALEAGLGVDAVCSKV